MKMTSTLTWQYISCTNHLINSSHGDHKNRKRSKRGGSKSPSPKRVRNGKENDHPSDRKSESSKHNGSSRQEEKRDDRHSGGRKSHKDRKRRSHSPYSDRWVREKPSWCNRTAAFLREILFDLTFMNCQPRVYVWCLILCNSSLLRTLCWYLFAF